MLSANVLNFLFSVWVLTLLILTLLVCAFLTARIRYWWRKGTLAHKQAREINLTKLIQANKTVEDAVARTLVVTGTMPNKTYTSNASLESECERIYAHQGLDGMTRFISELRDNRQHGDAFVAVRWLEHKRLNDG